MVYIYIYIHCFLWSSQFYYDYCSELLTYTGAEVYLKLTQVKLNFTLKSKFTSSFFFSNFSGTSSPYKCHLLPFTFSIRTVWFIGRIIHTFQHLCRCHLTQTNIWHSSFKSSGKLCSANTKSNSLKTTDIKAVRNSHHSAILIPQLNINRFRPTIDFFLL